MTVKNLFGRKMVVLNIGLKIFADSLEQQQVETARVAWRPPVDREIDKLLRKVL